MISRQELRDLFRELDRKFNSPRMSSAKDSEIGVHSIKDSFAQKSKKKLLL